MPISRGLGSLVSPSPLLPEMLSGNPEPMLCLFTALGARVG